MGFFWGGFLIGMSLKLYINLMKIDIFLIFQSKKNPCFCKDVSLLSQVFILCKLFVLINTVILCFLVLLLLWLKSLSFLAIVDMWWIYLEDSPHTEFSVIPIALIGTFDFLGTQIISPANYDYLIFLSDNICFKSHYIGQPPRNMLIMGAGSCPIF